MELIVLGSSGTWPNAGIATSGYLVRHDGFNLYMDAGTGTLANLQKHIAIEDVDAIVVSHEHPDHFVDLYPFFYAWHYGELGEPGLPVFGSRIQQVEHIGYTLLLADRAGVHAPKVVRTGVGGAEAAVLVTTLEDGRPLASLEADEITDDMLASLWCEIDQLHRAGISHGELDPLRIRVADGHVALDDFSAADATGEQFWMDRDVAAVLVATSLRVAARPPTGRRGS